eukprot:496778_1
MSKQQQFSMNPVGRMIWRMQTPNNPQTISFGFEIDGQVDTSKVVQICNQRFLKLNRLKSIVVNDTFQILQNFNCKDNIYEFNIDEPFPIGNRKSANRMVINLTSKEAHTQIKYKTKPLWHIKIYKYKNNKSVLLFSMHHCIGDGNVYLELLKLLCNIPSNLSNNELLINYNKQNIIHRFFQFMRSIYLTLTFIYKFFVCHIFRYYWNKIFYRNRIYIFETPLSGKNNVDVLEFTDTNIKQTKKYLVQQKGCIKHTFNDFLLTVIAETLICFMKKYKHLTDEQIPPEINIIVPCNLRPFYDNFKSETIMGNVDGTYNIILPLDPKLSFCDRLKIIKQRMDYSKSINEAYYTYIAIKYFWSVIPKSLLKWIYLNASKVMPMLVSGVKEYKDKKWKLFGDKLLTMLGTVPLSPGIPIAFGFFTQPNSDSIAVSVVMDNNICGQNGAELMMNCMRDIMGKYGVVCDKRATKSNL